MVEDGPARRPRAGSRFRDAVDNRPDQEHPPNRAVPQALRPEPAAGRAAPSEVFPDSFIVAGFPGPPTTLARSHEVSCCCPPTTPAIHSPNDSGVSSGNNPSPASAPNPPCPAGA
ncbi:hypothetical protein JCM2811A_21100 [Methylorubrum rhodinum]